MQYTVGKLARKFGLSRSTLLYYDSIGLLEPGSHTKGEYRIYSEAEEKRLEQICIYRKAGLSLQDIGEILDSPDSDLAFTLRRRFDELNSQIDKLHEQQKIVASLLKNKKLLKESNRMTKERWVSILKSSGYSQNDMRNWHIGFEKTSPDNHLKFLQYLGLKTTEIEAIRAWGEDDAADLRAENSD